MKKYTLVTLSLATLMLPSFSFASSEPVDTSIAVDAGIVVDSIHPTIEALMNRYDTVLNGDDAKNELANLRKEVGEKLAQKIEDKVYEVATKIVQNNLDNTEKAKKTLYKLGDALNKKVTKMESEGVSAKKLAIMKLLLQEVTIAFIAIENQYHVENPEAPMELRFR